MPLDFGARQWHIALIEQDCSLVEPAKKVNLTLLSGMKVKEPSREPSKVVRLLYTNSGMAVLALASNAVHKLWKWQRSERNPSGKDLVCHSCGSLLMGPSCLLTSTMPNKPKTQFHVMTTFMPAPPAATYLAFHPQDNNIIAIGMEDSSIQIYNVRVDELPINGEIIISEIDNHAKVKTKLKGHQKRISRLAFSQRLNILVSSGADAQLCIWTIDGWEKKKSRGVQAPPGNPTPLVGETRVHSITINLIYSSFMKAKLQSSILSLNVCIRGIQGIHSLPRFQVLYTCVMACRFLLDFGTVLLESLTPKA